MIDTSWITDEASCRGLPATLWFPPEHQPDDPGKRICADCPLRLRCLEHAIEYHEPAIWGGTSDKQRREIRAARKRGQVGPIEVRLLADRPRPTPKPPTRGQGWNRVTASDVEHGTYSGYRWHRRNRAPMCDECGQAKRDYDKGLRLARRGVAV